jgi:hypothetical protein
MAYYLHYTPVNGKYIEIPVINVPSATDFSIEFEWFNLDTDRGYPLAAVSSGTSQIRIEPSTTSNTVALVNSGGISYTFNFGSMVRSDFNLFKFTRTGNSISLQINGNPIGSPVVGSGVLNATFAFTRIFIRATTTAFAESGLKFLKYTQAGVLTRHYDANASGGTGNILPELVSSANGAQIGAWPTDNSEWTFYDDGGATTSTVAFTMPQFSLAASLTDSEPAATSATIAFTMPQFVPAVSASDTAPEIAVTAAFTMPQFTLAASASVTLPTYTATVAFSMPQFGLSASLSDTAPEFTATASFTMPQFALSASLTDTDTPMTSASVSFTMPSFTVASVASVINPDKPLIGFWLSDRGIAGYRRGFNSY